MRVTVTSSSILETSSRIDVGGAWIFGSRMITPLHFSFNRFKKMFVDSREETQRTLINQLTLEGDYYSE